jgi:hypothetical protein
LHDLIAYFRSESEFLAGYYSGKEPLAFVESSFLEILKLPARRKSIFKHKRRGSLIQSKLFENQKKRAL